MDPNGRSGGPIRLLHVDDDTALAATTAALLERRRDGFDVDHAANADAGLEVLASGTYDCVLSDYDMPGPNGVEFLAAVREVRADLPFILYTGKGSEEVASEAIAAGVTDYVQKGRGDSHYEQLAARIEHAVETHEHQQRAADEARHLSVLAEHTDDGGWLHTAD